MQSSTIQELRKVALATLLALPLGGGIGAGMAAIDNQPVKRFSMGYQKIRLPDDPMMRAFVSNAVLLASAFSPNTAGTLSVTPALSEIALR